jgi:hypothetical protein
MESEEKGIEDKYFHSTLPEIIFISLMAGLNVGLNLIISPPLKVILPHVIIGMFLMVPFDLVFIALCKFTIKKPWTSTFYLLIFSILAIPTTMFGAVPGIYKIAVGLFIGILLDIAFLPKNDYLKIITGGILGSIFWWLALFTVWQLLYPREINMVFIFSNLLNGDFLNFNEVNGFLDLSLIVELPITGFGVNFLKFSLLVGLISSIPCILGIFGGYGLFISIKKTSIFEKFQAMR